MKNFEVLAVITARGGSKSIPKKNIRDLCGKPLIYWTIEEAKKSRLITRTIVSTDDKEIAEVARKFGAEVPFLRPEEISGDLSHSIEAVLHALKFLKEKEGYEPEAVVLLPPTAPLRAAADIDKGIETLFSHSGADSARPIIESPKHPYKTLTINGDYLKTFFSKDVTGFDEPHDLPRQLFPKAYIYSGALQVTRTKTILEQRSLTGKKSVYFFMKPEDSINIDNLIDFRLAEILMSERLKQV